jgi:hypothetical protein
MIVAWIAGGVFVGIVSFLIWQEVSWRRLKRRFDKISRAAADRWKEGE